MQHAVMTLAPHCCCPLQALKTLPDKIAAVGVRLKMLPLRLNHLVDTIPAWHEVRSHALPVSAALSVAAAR